MKTLTYATLFLVLLAVLSGCTGKPDGVTPVTPFALERYLGEWHEIARLDHRFERGLTDVTANYSLREDGGVKVINRGFNAEDNAWEQAEGKAYFVGDSNTGALKVSFFGPFYGSYNVARLSDDYSMALVVGPSLDYAWLLSRSKAPPKAQCDAFMQTATDLGIKPGSWIWLQQCSTE
ncbi:lipocalin family protein [Rheinheimera aquimaris]|jgi:apolipoprotein D and lipocalin family protein|uniref:lipocalin family protein n=1 Tax=Rheinheimera aquimaris TaxID=412437 RepID=UPI0010666CC2|nr:lipocalin family protein [Rheinheimera aquimaris]MCD1598544.1 lipocalin family protein [Rheinheimera aquimaris]|tara:strand:- start:3741 stop:4274 length:534 start_codon:yes stop_codon:yes gene_type:complete